MEGLKDITNNIQKEYRSMSLLQMKSLDKAHLIGTDLIKAKKLLKKGQWGPWLKENFAFSGRASRQYMDVARNWELVEKLRESNPKLGLNDALFAIRESRKPKQAPEDTATDTEKPTKPKKSKPLYKMPIVEHSGLIFHLEQINVLIAAGEFNNLSQSDQAIAQIELYKLKAIMDGSQISTNQAA